MPPACGVAVSMGTVFNDQAKAHFPLATIVAVQSPATGFQEVLAGRADVTITSNVEASTLIKRFDQLAINVPGADMRNKRPFAYVLPLDDVSWLNYVNTWVTLKRIEGYFAGLEKEVAAVGVTSRPSRILAAAFGLAALLTLGGCAGPTYSWGWHVVSPFDSRGVANLIFLTSGVWASC